MFELHASNPFLMPNPCPAVSKSRLRRISCAFERVAAIPRAKTHVRANCSQERIRGGRYREPTEEGAGKNPGLQRLQRGTMKFRTAVPGRKYRTRAPGLQLQRDFQPTSVLQARAPRIRHSRSCSQPKPWHLAPPAGPSPSARNPSSFAESRSRWAANEPARTPIRAAIQALSGQAQRRS